MPIAQQLSRLLWIFALVMAAASMADEADTSITNPEPKSVERSASSQKGFLSIGWSPVWSDRLWSGSSEREAHDLPDSTRTTPVRTNTQEVFFNASWQLPMLASARILVPVLWRDHASVGPGESLESKGHLVGVGDILIGGMFSKIQGLPFRPNVDIKLPTGSTTDKYSSGPRTGKKVEREAQLGTGSTDLIVGASLYAAEQSLSASAQIPTLHDKGFTPGSQIRASWSYNFLRMMALTPQLQVKADWVLSASGSEADADNTGSFQVDLVPRLHYWSDGFGLWTEFDLPVYQRVEGLQTVPGYRFSLGLSSRL